MTDFERKLLKVIRRLLRSHAHANVIVNMKGGELGPVRIDQSFLPATLPEMD